MTHHARRGHAGRVLAVAGSTTLALLGSASPSSAGEPIIENGHFRGADTHIEQEAHPGWCPNVDFSVEFSGRFTSHFLTMKRGVDGLWYFSGGFESHGTYTNLENGQTLTERGSARWRDTRITDNGDGTITIEAADVGTHLLFGPDGRQLGHDAGRRSFTVVIDTNGTVEPDDDVVVWETMHPATGTFTLGELDWCGLVEEQLG